MVLPHTYPSMAGQTPGKKRMGIRAVHDGGYPLTARGAAVRNLLRVLDMQPGMTWVVSVWKSMTTSCIPGSATRFLLASIGTEVTPEMTESGVPGATPAGPAAIDPEKLDMLERELLTLAKQHKWQLEAWAVFVNHYHFVARGDDKATPLEKFLKHLHSNSARQVNELDASVGRKVWHNFWETELTYERSYLARLNYVHQNAVKHKLVAVANQYPWCSAARFERVASPAQVKTIYGFKIDRVKVEDDF